jgi:trehalose 6-phosphate synthase/phosphatase
MAKLIIVSNRLPFTFKKVAGELTYTQGGGGLATALSSYAKNNSSLWIGWPGIAAESLTESDKAYITRTLKKHRCHPVFLTQKQIDQFYSGYSNSVLWPLFHDMPVTTGDTAANWRAYREVNQLYTDTALQFATPKDTIWIHDYQLLLMPEMVRVRRPDGKMGFFLHIPFPKYERLSQTPHAAALLRGTLGADLVGFHTPSYVKNYLEACTQAEVGTVGVRKVILSVRVVRVTDFPIGIDYDSFANATKNTAAALEYKKLQLKYLGKKVILMSDRIDPSKGLIERLTAYQTLLRQNPKLHGAVVLAMIGMPSRLDITVYAKLFEQVKKLVRDINREFGTNTWRPVDAVFEPLPFERYVALYRRADIAFIAPLRDGMNLVAKEFLASATKHDGVLVLSETAGAAEELKDAVLVNPKRPKTLVKGLQTALTMPRAELRRRTATMQRHVKQFDVNHWVGDFIGTLEKPRANPVRLHRTKSITIPLQDKLIAQYHLAHKRLLMFDYDGTLTPIVSRPEDAKPTPQLKALLCHLAEDPQNDVLVVSGRSRADLQAWLGDIPIALAAEHGAMFRRKDGDHWHHTTHLEKTWRDEIGAIMQHYATKTPGAEVERKEWAIVWHYRNAAPFYAQKHLVALRQLIKPLLKKHGLKMKDGKMILEVSPAEINKGRIAQEWLIHDHDFILAAGDDTTDEDMFAALPVTAYSIKIGRGRTTANYRLPDVPAIHHLLRKL